MDTGSSTPRATPGTSAVAARSSPGRPPFESARDAPARAPARPRRRAFRQLVHPHHLALGGQRGVVGKKEIELETLAGIERVVAEDAHSSEADVESALLAAPQRPQERQPRRTVEDGGLQARVLASFFVLRHEWSPTPAGARER